jgi:hypothetical protein
LPSTCNRGGTADSGVTKQRNINNTANFVNKA